MPAVSARWRCLTRSTGLLLVLPLAVEALRQARAASGPLRPRLVRLVGALSASATALLCTGGYLLYWKRFGGSWLRPLEVQGATWSRERSWPWETLLAGAREGVRYFGGYHTVDLVLDLVALAAGGWLALRVRATYAV